MEPPALHAALHGKMIVTLDPATRNSLLLSIRDPGDRMAWEEFVQIYEPVIYRLLRGARVQDADARDLTQEIFVKIHQHIDRWKVGSEHGSFRGWLRRIVRNQTISWWRANARDVTRKSLWDPQVLESTLTEWDDGCQEFDREVERALFRHAASLVQHEFESTTWQAFWLVAVLHRSIASVATELKLSQGAVRVAKCRVIARLKKVVEELQNEDQPRVDL